MAVRIQTINTESEWYPKMLELRNRVLLAPIGVPFSYIKPEQEKNDILIVAVEGKAVLGCCVLTDRGESVIQLRQMAVDTSVQAKGLGRTVVHFAEQLAKEKGYRNLYLNSRDPVIPFYEKCGYTISGDGFTEVNIAHHRMQKSL